MLPTPGDGRRSDLAPSSDVGVSIEERDGDYVVLADLPGFEPEELDLTVDDGVLTMAGTHEDRGDVQYRRRVHETVAVPDDAVAEEASATYRNGVLEIGLPVATDADDGHVVDVG